MSPATAPGVVASAAAVAIVVLNWNGCDDTLRCLDSLAQHAPAATPVVVDNGSTDDSVAAIRSRFPALTVIETGENLGYAGGNNRGLRWALDHDFDVIGVLNNDTVVLPGFLEPLVAAATAGRGRCAVAPEIRYLDGDGVWFAGSRLDPRLGIHVHTTATLSGATITAPALTGCAVFAHQQTWRRMGLFDDSYFLIFEDAEWSARAARLGCELQVVGASTIRHAVSSSFAGDAGRVSSYYYLRNGLRLLRSQRASRATQARFARFCVAASARGARAAPRSAPSATRYVVLGLVDGLRDRGGPLRTAPAVGRVDRSVLKQRTKQALRKAIGEPFVGKRSKLRRFERVLPGLGLQPHDVLDVGSEDATFVYWLADHWPDAHITAIDIDEAAVRSCLLARPPAYATRVDFEVAALADLPAGRYDVVTAFDVLEHIPDDRAAVADIFRALRPGGRFVAHVPRDWWMDAHGRIERVADHEAWRINPGHVRMGYSPEGLTSLLEQAGFRTDPPAVWLQRWSVRAFWLYFAIEKAVPLRLLTIPVTDLAARLDERRPQDEGNTVFVVGTKPADVA